MNKNDVAVGQEYEVGKFGSRAVVVKPGSFTKTVYHKGGRDFRGSKVTVKGWLIWELNSQTGERLYTTTPERKVTKTCLDCLGNTSVDFVCQTCHDEGTLVLATELASPKPRQAWVESREIVRSWADRCAAKEHAALAQQARQQQSSAAREAAGVLQAAFKLSRLAGYATFDYGMQGVNVALSPAAALKLAELLKEVVPS